MTVDANTLFGALAAILKALTILLLAIDTIASAWRMLNRLRRSDCSCSLLGHARVFYVKEYVLILGFLGKDGVQVQWVLEHVFLKVDTKNVIILKLVQFFLAIVILVVGEWESLFFKEKLVHSLKKLIQINQKLMDKKADSTHSKDGKMINFGSGLTILRENVKLPKKSKQKNFSFFLSPFYFSIIRPLILNLYSLTKPKISFFCFPFFYILMAMFLCQIVRGPHFLNFLEQIMSEIKSFNDQFLKSKNS